MLCKIPSKWKKIDKDLNNATIYDMLKNGDLPNLSKLGLDIETCALLQIYTTEKVMLNVLH